MTTTTSKASILLTSSSEAHPRSTSKQRSTASASSPSYAVKTAKQLTAGALSGLVEVSLTYPTDYVKIMLQLEEGKKGTGVRRFRNSADVIRQTVRSHGLVGLYRGFSVVFYGALPKYMFRFGAYEQTKQLYVDEYGQLAPTDKLLCGLAAGLSEALFAVIPQESVKVKFINDRCSEQPRYRGLLHGIREIVREKGLRGTYQGVTPTVLKQSSNQAIRFFVFESLMEWWQKKQGGDSSANHSKFVVPLFGAIAGAVSVFGNTPLDVIKTRMQGLEAAKYRGTMDCILQIGRNEGLMAFYKGTMPRLTKVTLEVAIAFSAYQAFLDFFFK